MADRELPEGVQQGSADIQEAAERGAEEIRARQETKGASADLRDQVISAITTIESRLVMRPFIDMKLWKAMRQFWTSATPEEMSRLQAFYE